MLNKLRRAVSLILLVIVVVLYHIVFSAISNGPIALSLISNLLPESWEPFLWSTPQLFGICIVAGIALALLQAQKNKPPSIKQIAPSRNDITIAKGYTNLPATRVDFTEKSQALRDRKEMLDLVYDTWIEGILHKSLSREVKIELNWQTPISHREPERLLPGKNILEVFEMVNSALLILGEPGSGKTTTLLQLAKQTIERAKLDEDQPIPVIFDLSSWTPKQTIADWLVNELKEKYFVRKKIGNKWVENNELLLLFDSLDEVKAEYRVHCSLAINMFLIQHPVAVAVCCQSQDYDELLKNQSLDKVWGAISIQPLSAELIHTYLLDAGVNQIIEDQVFKKGEELDNFFQTPLALNIFLVAYKNTSEQNSFMVATEPRKHLLDVYIQQMLHLGTQNARYSTDQTKRWLACFAFQLKQRGQNIFHIENTDQEWLPTVVQRKVFLTVLQLGGGILSGLLSGLIAGRIFGLENGLASGLVTGLFIGLTLDRGFLPFHPAETLKWSWQKAKQGLSLALLIVMIVGLIIYILQMGIGGVLIIGGYYKNGSGWFDIMRDSLILSMIIWLFGGVLFLIGLGLYSPGIEERRKPKPGIRNSIIKRAFAFLKAILFIGLAIGLSIIFGLFGGSFVIPIFAFFYGRFLFFHYLLHCLLYQNKLVPWNMVDFLDYAADLMFLRKVGSGYIFIHRTLMEHFAAIWEEEIANAGK